MDLKKLRDLLRHPVEGLSTMGSHRELEFVLEKAGLEEAGGGSKTDRMRQALLQTPDDRLPDVAAKLLANFDLGVPTRMEIEDVLWQGVKPEIPVRVRHEIANALESLRDDFGNGLFINFAEFSALFDRLFHMGKVNYSTLHRTVRQDLRGWFVEKTNEVTVAHLFERVGAFDAIHKRFALLLEGLCSWRVQPNEKRQREIVGALNAPLAKAHLEMAEVGDDGGYPLFTLAPKRSGVSGRPKNIIFAGPKPDLRFKDAVNNDVEICSNPDDVLVFDDPIPEDGVSCRTLVAWWAARRGCVPSREVAQGLRRRLAASIPRVSPRQLFLFDTYFELFKDADAGVLPALLPEVYHHWDPQSRQQRRSAAMPTFRADFLILLSHAIRIVLEVDGKGHYAVQDQEGKWQVSPNTYGASCRADRELRLAGYEVYRFGGAEMEGESGKALLRDFFSRLFDRHHRAVQPRP